MSEFSALPRRERRRDESSAKRTRVDNPITQKYKYIVVGGGIAGVSCAQELSLIHSKDRILLISVSEILKEAKTIMKATKYVEEVAVYEKSCDALKVDRWRRHAGSLMTVPPPRELSSPAACRPQAAGPQREVCLTA